MSSAVSRWYVWILAVASAVLAVILLTTPVSAANPPASPSNVHPDTSPAGQPITYMITQLCASTTNCMPGKITPANIYVPKSIPATSNITVTIIDGCHTSIDNTNGSSYTSYTIYSAAGNVSTNTGNCGNGATDLSLTFKPNPNLDGWGDYNKFLFLAEAVGTNNRDGIYYYNHFRLSAANTSVRIGITELLVSCNSAIYPNYRFSCPSTNVAYSSLAQPPSGSPSGGYWEQQIVVRCEVTAFLRLDLFDMDAGDYSQDNIRGKIDVTGPGGNFRLPSPNIPALNAINDDGIIMNVLPGSGNNDNIILPTPPGSGLESIINQTNIPANTDNGRFRLDPGKTYTFRIKNMTRVNTLSILAELSLKNDGDEGSDCGKITLTNVSCSITGPIRIRNGATSVAVPVRINAVAGSAVPAGTRVSGLHLGVTANGDPENTWDDTGAPVPAPDDQNLYEARSAGISGVTHYDETASISRYWVNNALAEGASRIVNISVDIGSKNDLSRDLVVRMLDRAGGRWLANYCSVKINRNSIPTISINGTPGCTNFSGNYRDGDGDDVSVYLLVNGQRVLNANGSRVAAFNLTDQPSSAKADTPYSFNLRSWRDFNARNFRVVVSDGLDTDSTGNQSVGPCINMACGGATVTPASLEVNEPFSISVNFIMRYIAGGGNATIGSRGQAVTYNVSLTVSPPPGAAPVNPVVGTTTIPAGGTNSRLIHNNLGGFTASNDPTNYDIAYRLNGVNNANATSVPCPTAGETAGVTSSRMPYIQVFRGDVIAGYGVKNNQGICATTANAGVRARSRTLVGTTELVGSGTQMAVFARGPVQGFRSAITDAATGVNSRPWQRIFANSVESGNSGVAATDSNFSQNFGGSFNSSLCAENWSEGIPNSATPFTPNPVNGSADIDVATVFNVVRYDGNVRLNASEPLKGSRKIYVDGDVIIGDAFPLDQRLVYDAGPWGSVFDIPSFTLVATGDIIIDDNVTRLDGVFVSGGTVFTCAPTGGARRPTRTDVISQSGFSPDSYKLNGQCNTIPLSLHGAIVGNSIRLWRTGGTLSQSVNGSSTGIQSYVDGLTRAETFRLPPEVFVAPRFDEDPINGETGKKQYDSLISLPPPF